MHKKDKPTIRDISQFIASLIFVASIGVLFLIMGAWEQFIIGDLAFAIGAVITLAVMFISMLVAGLTQEDERRNKYDRQ